MEDSFNLIDVAVHSDLWFDVMTTEKWKELFERTYDVVFGEQKKKNVSVCLTNNEEMATLNGQYRQKHTPTNVLAFPQDSTHLLGDIVLAYGIIQEEALNQKKDFLDHVTHLFVHGLLHLNGYDHETQEEAHLMENLEIDSLSKLGVKNPYV